MDVCGCSDYDVAVFGGEKKNFSLFQLLIYTGRKPARARKIQM